MEAEHWRIINHQSIMAHILGQHINSGGYQAALQPKKVQIEIQLTVYSAQTANYGVTMFKQ